MPEQARREWALNLKERAKKNRNAKKPRHSSDGRAKPRQVNQAAPRLRQQMRINCPSRRCSARPPESFSRQRPRPKIIQQNQTATILSCAIPAYAREIRKRPELKSGTQRAKEIVLMTRKYETRL